MTFNFGVKKSIVHEDHNFDHKQLIIYLNDCDQNSKTILLNNKNKVIKERLTAVSGQFELNIIKFVNDK